MGNSFRNQPYPTMYGELQTPVTQDITQMGLIFAFAIIAFSFILIIPGIRGWERLWSTIRVFTALWIGAILLICNYGSWYADSICTKTQYKAHTKPNSDQLIYAKVGISISLRGFNVTLKESKDGCGSDGYVRPFPGEEIDYVESFRWAPTWAQGRLDYGKFGGQLRQEYREAQYQGLPYPILWVAEHFLMDGDQYIWYRRFRVAGWYTHIWMWTGFATYLISILLFIYNIRYGAWFMFLTGSMLLLAILSYSVIIQNDPSFRIHFPDGIIRPKFNYAFYLSLFTGFCTCVAAIVIIVMDFLYPRKTAAFFHHGLIEDDAIFEGILEEEEEEFEGLERKVSKISYGRGAGGKIQRKGTISHVRDSIRSNKSAGGRSDVLPRQKSATSLGFPAPVSPTSAAEIGHDKDDSMIKEGAIELEVVTVYKDAVEV